LSISARQPPRASACRPGSEQREHLARLGKALDAVLGEHKLAVSRDIEDAAAALAKLGLYAELLLDLARQTGGAGLVASGRAVGDRDSHAVLLIA
jgi:hypothetical protein